MVYPANYTAMPAISRKAKFPASWLVTQLQPRSFDRRRMLLYGGVTVISGTARVNRETRVALLLPMTDGGIDVSVSV